MLTANAPSNVIARETNGRFATRVNAESTVDLSTDNERLTAAGATTDRLVAYRRSSDGVYVPADVAEGEVRDELRELYADVDEADFENHFQLIAEAAGEVSRAEWNEDRDLSEFWGNSLYRRLKGLDDEA